MTAADNLRYTGAPDRPRARRARGEDQRRARSRRPARRRRQAGRDLLARHAPAARPRRDPDEGRPDRDPRRADLRPRSAGDARAAGDHPQAQAATASPCCCRRICSIACRACATASRCSTTGKIALLGTVGELGRQVLGGGFNVEVEAEGHGLAQSGSRPIPGVTERRGSRARTAGGCWPTATCGRRRRPRWSTPAAGCCGCRSRSRASRPSTPATSRAISTGRAPCGVKVRPGTALGVVILKELSDHLTSARMRVLEWLVVLIALAALYGAIQQIRDVDRGGSVPVPAAVHDRARAAAVVRVVPELPGAADRDRARLRRGQRRAQPAHAVAHPGAADLSRRAAVREVPRRPVHAVDQPGRAVAAGDRARPAAARRAAERARRWRARSSSCW